VVSGANGRIAFTQLDLRHDLANSILAGHDIPLHAPGEIAPVARCDARGFQQRLGICPDRDVDLRTNDLQSVAGEILKAAHSGGVLTRCDHDETVLRKDPVGTQNHVGAPGDIHLYLVGAGEHVGARAVFELHSQLARAAKAEHHPGVRMRAVKVLGDVFEGVGERRRREHHNVT